MRLLNKAKNLILIGSFALMLSFLVGCGGVTEEQLAQLDALKKEVASLEKESTTLKDERARLEREISEKNKKLEECAKLKAETKANLDKLPK